MEPADRVAQELDQELALLQEQVNSLKHNLSIQATNLLSADSTRQILKDAAQRSDPLGNDENIITRSQEQDAHDQENLYRTAAGITSFKVQDPDPNAVDGGRVLGLRFEVVSKARFLRPYYVMLNRPYADSQHLRVHRHTVPPAIPLSGLAARHLPEPKAAAELTQGGSGEPQTVQDLSRFVRELRREITRYHNRGTAVGELGDGAAAAWGNAADDEDREGMLADVRAADAQLKQAHLEWVDGRTGRLVMDDDGQIEKLVIYREDTRDWAAQRELAGDAKHVEDIVRLMKSRAQAETDRGVFVSDD